MLRSRGLSTFTIIGAILIVLGIVGLVMGPRFVFDPGQPVTGKEAWCYLIIGLLMVVNGLITPPQPEEKQPPRVAGKSSGQSGPRPSDVLAEKQKAREATLTTADKGAD